MEAILKTLDEEFKKNTAEEKLDDLFENLDIKEPVEDLSKKVLQKYTPPVIAGIHQDWWNILIPNNEIGATLQSTLNKIAAIEIKPIHRDIFNFARFCDPKNIKVLILGQDPYDTECHAHGLAFSSQQPNTPKSLANIFKALAKSGLLDKIKQKPLTNNLTGWAAQGVILLNTALTVLPDKPKSHLAEWQPYVIELCKSINRHVASQGKRLIVILWGKEAERYEQYFAEGPTEQLKWSWNYILKYHHPSPLAGDFSDCPNFLECNALLTGMNQTPIIWDPDYPSWCEVYTDGSSLPNTTGPEVASGYSALFTTGLYKHLKLYGRTENVAPFYSNNIRAEGTALIKAMERVAMMPAINRQTLHIVTDCEFWINMIRTWIPNWIEKFGIEIIDDYEINNPNHHKNPDLVKKLWQLYDGLQASGTYIVISHVYSHDQKIKGKSIKPSQTDKLGTEYSRYIYNKLVDALANHVRQKLQNGQYGEMMTEMSAEGFKF